MHLGQSCGSVSQSHSRNPFEFSPAPGAKLAPNPHDVPDSAADGNRGNALNVTDNLEIHGSLLCSGTLRINCKQHDDLLTHHSTVTLLAWFLG
jgi:hypothetical protein